MADSVKYTSPIFCEIYLKGKQNRPSLLEVTNMYVYVCGNVNSITNDGKSYFITFINPYSHFCVKVKPLKNLKNLLA